MKKLVLFILLFVSVVAKAQKGISYQAVILDPAKIELPGSDISGQPLVNGNVSVKFVIVSGTNIQFEEIQQTKTDAYGLVNLTIGSLANTAFNAITWDATQKSLQVFVSFNNGASYTKVSDQKLSYSPYALFAETAGKLGSTLGIAGGGTGATTAAGARANLGLGNVDNTADADKPISTATQAALNLKANVADVNAALDLKASAAMLAAHMAITVDTNMLATKAALTDLNNYAPINSPTFTGTVSGVTKSMVGLGSVDNTSDAAKPISTATQAALSTKASLASPALIGVPTAPTAAPGTNSTQIATTAYTTAAIAAATAASGVADNSITSAKIANGAVTDAKITSVAGNKITGVIPVTNGGTGQSTVAGILSTLGFASNNIAIGSQAGTPNQGVNANTIAIGGGAARTNQGQSSIAIGYVSGDTNQGANSISIGGNAAQGGQGSQAVAIGFAAGQNGQGANAVAIGTFAGQSSQAANSIAINATGTSTPLNPTTTGFFVNPIRSTTATSNLLYYNTSTKEITSGAGSFVDLTTNQTIAGVKTFSSNISANGVSLGRGAGNNDESVAIGQGAMGSSNSNGKRNTALGAFAMARYNGTAWDNNTSIGYNNLPNMTSGSGNTSVGAESMMSLVTGQENTSIGNQSLISVTGNSNVGVGKRSGQTITSGSQNTILGTDADVSSATLNNATAIGYGAQVTASNAIQLGNSSVTNVKTSGSITAGAGESTIAGTMVVGGSSATGTSAALEVKSTTQGLLLPRLTTAQRDAISSPSQGLLVYNTSTSKFQGYANDAVFGNISAITSQTNSANNGYLSLGSFIMDQSSLVTASQIFTASSITQITSIGVYFSGAGTPGNVTLSVYTGSTIGSGSLLGSIVANVSSIGLKTFTFDGPITVFQGASYYFKLTPALNTNLGLDYDNTAFIDGASYQSQTYGSNPTNNSTISNKSYRFVINGLSGTIASQTNSANNGYLSLSSRPSNSIVTTASQVFALNLKTQLSSVGVYFSGTGGPGVVTLSLYSGSTIGSGTVLGTASTTVSSIGLNNFVFADPIILPPGSYYFKLTPSANTNLGLDYSNSLYSGGASYQNQNSLNNSYRFEINGATATSGWVDLN